MKKKNVKKIIVISNSYLQNKQRSSREKTTVECSSNMVRKLLNSSFTKDTIVKDYSRGESAPEIEIIYAD